MTPQNLEIRIGEFLLSTDRSKLQIDVIWNFLKTTYWAKNIPKSLVEKSMKNSLCFGIYKDHQQVGFARVISDYATFAYLADVFILNEYRGKNLALRLMQFIQSHPELQKLRRWMLATWDAHRLYRRIGFKTPDRPDRLMEIVNMDLYS